MQRNVRLLSFDGEQGQGALLSSLTRLDVSISVRTCASQQGVASAKGERVPVRERYGVDKVLK